MGRNRKTEFFSMGGGLFCLGSADFLGFCGGGAWWWCCFVGGGGGAAIRPSFAVYVAHVVYLLLLPSLTYYTELYL
jgi:hypothetical protein